MPFAACLSLAVDADRAIDEVCAHILQSLGQQVPDLTVVFVSHHHRDAFATLAGIIQSRLKSRVVIGCAGEFIAGGDQEIEGQAALSIWSAVLPGAELIPFHVQFETTPDGIVTSGWPEEIAGHADARAVLLFGEPFTTPIDAIIERLADELPKTALVGGMASGGRGPGQNCVFFNSTALIEGAVGVAIFGGPRVTAIVSQGCRPVGPNFVVTKAKDNVIVELGGKAPLQRLQEVYATLGEHDQALLQAGPHIGIVINEYKDNFGLGDYLISNVIGADRSSGAVAIGTNVRTGQTVRLHVRDAQTADEELRALLQRQCESDSSNKAALLFSCNGRGTRMFERSHHDASTIRSELGSIPLAGFFANGEFGPIGQKNHIHGYTASIVCFSE